MTTALYDFEAMSHEELLGTAEGMKRALDDLQNAVRAQRKHAEATDRYLAAAVLAMGGEVVIDHDSFRKAVMTDDYMIVTIHDDPLRRGQTLKVLRKDGKK